MTDLRKKQKFGKVTAFILASAFLLVGCMPTLETSLESNGPIVSKEETEGFAFTETEAPETEAPETEAPETEAPETEAPETEVPETEAPETKAPETKALETEAPETEAPETEAPETEAPETKAPETKAPETEAPETEALETEAPETENCPTESQTMEKAEEIGSSMTYERINELVGTAFFWAPSGNKIHINPHCRSFKLGVTYAGTFAEASSVRTDGFCGTCSKSASSDNNNRATAEVLESCYTFEDFMNGVPTWAFD